jgi:hypothetical protein
VPAAQQDVGPGVFGLTPHLSDLVFDTVEDTRAFTREKFGDVPEVGPLRPTLSLPFKNPEVFDLTSRPTCRILCSIPSRTRARSPERRLATCQR